MLTPEQIARRKLGIGGSDANRIMRGEEYQLWLEKTGQAEPEDLSWVLPVQIGVETEPLQSRWFFHHTGKVKVNTEHGFAVHHPENSFMFVHPDDLCLEDGRQIPIDYKHVNAWTGSIEDVLSQYYAQMQHSIACCDAPYAYISAFIGTQKWEHRRVDRDELYIFDMIERERVFWQHVENKTEPDRAVAPVKINVGRDGYACNFHGSNEFAYSAQQYLENEIAAGRYKDADKLIREMMPAKASIACGYGLTVKRDRGGKLRIYKTTDALIAEAGTYPLMEGQELITLDNQKPIQAPSK